MSRHPGLLVAVSALVPVLFLLLLLWLARLEDTLDAAIGRTRERYARAGGEEPGDRPPAGRPPGLSSAA